MPFFINITRYSFIIYNCFIDGFLSIVIYSFIDILCNIFRCKKLPPSLFWVTYLSRPNFFTMGPVLHFPRSNGLLMCPSKFFNLFFANLVVRYFFFVGRLTKVINRCRRKIIRCTTLCVFAHGAQSALDHILCLEVQFSTPDRVIEFGQFLLIVEQ